MNIDFYKDWAKNINNPEDIKPKGFEAQIKYDIEFLKNFADQNKVLLDLGAGTRSTINHLVNDFKKIIAIEKFKEFSKFIDKRIDVLNADLNEIMKLPKIDIITAFGVFNHFNDLQIYNLYNKVFNSLNDDGIFIIKHAMGIEKDILYKKNNYWAIYRRLTKEIEFLINSNFSILEIINIYNDKYKKEETIYFAIIGRKNG